MSGLFCHAGGTSRRIARTISIPPTKNSSSILSNELESEPVTFTKGAASCRSGINGVLNL